MTEVLVLLQPVEAGEQRLIGHHLIRPDPGQHPEFVGVLLHDHVLVQQVDDRRVDVPLDQGHDPVLRPGHEVRRAQRDAFALGDDLGQRLERTAAGVVGHRLAVHVLPALDLGVHDREEDDPAGLLEQAHRHARALDHRVGRAEADVGLAGEDRLDRQFLAVEEGQLVVEALLAGARQADQEEQGLDLGQIGERDVDRLRVLRLRDRRRPRSRGKRRGPSYE